MPSTRACSRRSPTRRSRSRSRPTSTGRAQSASSSRGRSPTRAKAGVTVKILLDAIGSASIGAEILRMLDEGGCQVAWYNPIHWYTLGRFNNRTHRKSLIVDGHIAFTGGAGIADHWRGNARGPHEWRDMQIRVEGPAVVPLQAGFAHNWQQSTGELLSGWWLLPDHRPQRSTQRADAHELARVRWLDRAHHVLPVDRVRAADRSTSPIRTSSLMPSRSTRSSTPGNAASTSRSWCRASATTTGSPVRTACACTAVCSKRASRSTNTTARCCITRRWSWTACG